MDVKFVIGIFGKISSIDTIDTFAKVSILYLPIFIDTSITSLERASTEAHQHTDRIDW